MSWTDGVSSRYSLFRRARFTPLLYPYHQQLPLRQQFLNDIPMYIGQTVVAALEFVDQSLVVDAGMVRQ